MYVTSQFWKSEQVCSGGGPKEPAQLHSLLNVGIQNGLSLLREDIKLQRCYLCPTFATVSPVRDLKIEQPWLASRVVISCPPETVPREKGTESCGPLRSSAPPVSRLCPSDEEASFFAG